MRIRNHIKTLVAALGCLVPSVGLLPASTVQIDFEGPPSVSGPTGMPIPANAALSNQLASASGIVFSSINGAPYVTVAELGSNHATSGVNGIGGAAANDTISYPTAIKISFVNPTNTALFRTVGSVSIKTDLIPDTTGTVMMAAYSAAGQLLVSDVKPDTAPQTLQVAASGIAWIELSSSQGSAAYDDLSYQVELPRTVIDFEGLPSISGPTGTSIPEETALGDQLAGSHGVVFSTVNGADYVVVAKLGLDHAASGTNGIGGASSSGRISYPNGVRIRFVNAEDPRFRAVTDSVSVKMDQYVEAGDVTITAYGASGELLGSETKPDTLGQTLRIDADGIHSVVLTSSGGSVAWDDLSFTPLHNVLSASVEVSAIKISWPTETGVKYQVQSATEPVMGVWTNVGLQVTGNGNVAFVEDEVVSGGPKKFYRVSVVP